MGTEVLEPKEKVLSDENFIQQRINKLEKSSSALAAFKRYTDPADRDAIKQIPDNASLEKFFEAKPEEKAKIIASIRDGSGKINSNTEQSNSNGIQKKEIPVIISPPNSNDKFVHRVFMPHITSNMYGIPCSSYTAAESALLSYHRSFKTGFVEPLADVLGYKDKNLVNELTMDAIRMTYHDVFGVVDLCTARDYSRSTQRAIFSALVATEYKRRIFNFSTDDNDVDVNRRMLHKKEVIIQNTAHALSSLGIPLDEIKNGISENLNAVLYLIKGAISLS